MTDTKSIRIYIADKPLILTQENIRSAGYLQQNDTTDLLQLLKCLEEKPEAKGIVVKTTSVEHLKNTLFKNYFSLEAAGGLVQNEKQQFLFILRLGKWDLPKGKIESGETPENAALREVEEECGLTDLTISKPLPATFHTYEMKNKKVLKKTFWYHMLCSDDANIAPQTEEDITEVKWMTVDEIKKLVIPNTYASIESLLQETILNR